MSPAEPDQLGALEAAKLGALIRSHLDSGIASSPTPARTSGTGSVVGSRAYRLANDERSLGPALHWASRQDAITELTLFAEPEVAGALARRAAHFDFDITVEGVEGNSSKPAQAKPLLPVPDLGDEIWQAATVIADAGARVVDDHGRLVAEVLGLEVARITTDSMTGEACLEVGVGEADRELQGYVHSHLDDETTLAAAVGVVARDRLVVTHPLNRLARPRWLRWMLLEDPAIIGLSQLEPLAPLRPASTVFDSEPSAAYSPADQVIVICSSGVDPDVLPEAADYRLRTDPDATIVVVVPERDASLVAGAIVELLPGAQVRPIKPPWDSLAS